MDSAIYVDGDRVSSLEELDEIYRQLHELSGAMAWIGLYRPNQQELTSVARRSRIRRSAV